MRISESMQKPGMHNPLRVYATCGDSPGEGNSRSLEALRLWLKVWQQPETTSLQERTRSPRSV